MTSSVSEANHADMVKTLKKPGEQISAEMTPQKWGNLLVAMREVIIAGQNLDEVKKQVIYNRESTVIGKPPRQLPHLSPDTWDTIHMTIGVVGEATELLEAVWLLISTGKLDRGNAKEELGDLEFYLEGFRQINSISRTETLHGNLEKLADRYRNYNYTDAAAIARADKRKKDA